MRQGEARRGNRRLTLSERDDLAWLRDRSDPRVLDLLRAENERTEGAMTPYSDLEGVLYGEMRGRVQETDRSVPDRRDGFFYFHRTEKGLPYRIWVRSTDPEGPGVTILDENELARGRDYCSVGGMAVSPDHRLLAYAFDITGDEGHIVRVRDLDSGEETPERIEGTTEDLAWATDSRTLFYVTRDAVKRASRVYRHRVGFDPSEDVLVFEEDDPAFHVALRASRSGRFIFISTASAITRDTIVVDAVDPDRPAHRLRPRVVGVEYDVHDGGRELFVVTNEAAKNFRVLKVPLDGGGTPVDRRGWTEERPHDPNVMLEGMEAFESFLVFVEREHGVRHLTIRPRSRTGDDYRVPIGAGVRTVEVGENHEFTTPRFRYVVSSPIQPATTHELDLSTREVERLHVEPIPGFDDSRYETARLWVRADDGVRIPVSIAHLRGLALDGTNPCLLNGYGAYGICYEPTFSRPVISLLDRGFVYAIAHVRGGGELGESWHDQGKMLSKRRSFTDFVACAERLISEGYTSPGRLGIQGRSAGGLLVGGVTNLRPELFQTVLAGVPFVDVLATMLDPSIPLTVIEYEEWGDPGDSEYYDYIRSYSPFDNVRETEYPNMLVTAGLNDPRVQFWEPARWVTRLRERRTDDRLLLLKTDMGAGHVGPSNRFEWLHDRAFEFAFLVATLAPETAEIEPLQ